MNKKLNKNQIIGEAVDTTFEVLEKLQVLIADCIDDALYVHGRAPESAGIGVIHALLRAASGIAVVAKIKKEAFLQYAGSVFDKIDDSGLMCLVEDEKDVIN